MAGMAPDRGPEKFRHLRASGYQPEKYVGLSPLETRLSGNGLELPRCILGEASRGGARGGAAAVDFRQAGLLVSEFRRVQGVGGGARKRRQGAAADRRE